MKMWSGNKKLSHGRRVKLHSPRTPCSVQHPYDFDVSILDYCFFLTYYIHFQQWRLTEIQGRGGRWEEDNSGRRVVVVGVEGRRAVVGGGCGWWNCGRGRWENN